MARQSTLITGAAGFIGFHLSKKLLEQNVAVVGLDNLNDYYDVNLKLARLKILKQYPNFHFVQEDLANKEGIRTVFGNDGFDHVVNLAAQAGVRYSLVNPYAYVDSNVTGFLNILEACRHRMPKHLVFASSSSVYGANGSTPFSVHDNVDHPLALYAATKKANELMAHAYSNLYHIPVTGLRFFTVYGPYGRPDMALFIFTKAILEGKPIDVYNFGKMKRDFTYIDDIVEGIVRLLPKAPEGNKQWDRQHPDPASSTSPYRLFNIGNNKSVQLMDFIGILETKLKRKATINLLPLQDGDVTETFADIADLELVTGFRPATTIDQGIENFVAWYKKYYNIA
ncbi:MAG: NAD-dependent epimerase [Cyclobacteriaceae bacterium]|nr:NAD-dependent epimerase [Cyclobacteriaceae bacterium]